jgi:hypothetical protein
MYAIIHNLPRFVRFCNNTALVYITTASHHADQDQALSARANLLAAQICLTMGQTALKIYRRLVLTD